MNRRKRTRRESDVVSMPSVRVSVDTTARGVAASVKFKRKLPVIVEWLPGAWTCGDCGELGLPMCPHSRVLALYAIQHQFKDLRVSPIAAEVRQAVTGGHYVQH